ncbi:hypothetical protein P9112_010938 [Eukaryota sp. TZLM1-RC]
MFDRFRNSSFVEEAFYADDRLAVIERTFEPNSLDYIFWKVIHLQSTTEDFTLEEQKLLKSLSLQNDYISDQLLLRRLFSDFPNLSPENRARLFLFLHTNFPSTPDFRAHTKPSSRMTNRLGSSPDQPPPPPSTLLSDHAGSSAAFDVEDELRKVLENNYFSQLNISAFEFVFSNLGNKDQLKSFFHHIRNSFPNLVYFKNPSSFVKSFFKISNSSFTKSIGDQLALSEMKTLSLFSLSSDYASVIIKCYIDKIKPKFSNPSEIFEFYQDLLKFVDNCKDSFVLCKEYLSYLSFLIETDKSIINAKLLNKITKYFANSSCGSIKRAHDDVIIDPYDVIDEGLITLFSQPNPPSPYDFGKYQSESYRLDLFVSTRLSKNLEVKAKFLEKVSKELLSQSTSAVVCRFSRDTLRHFDLSEAVKLKIEVQNSTCLINVYEVDLPNFYLFNDTDLSTAIKTDGLIPSWSKFLEKSSNQFLEEQVIEIPNSNQRCCLVADVVGQTQSSRVIIWKGNLSIFTFETADGLYVSVLDENESIISDCDLIVYCDGEIVQSTLPGLFLLPHPHRQLESKIVAVYNGFATRVKVVRKDLLLSCELNVVSDQEQLIPDTTAKILVIPFVQLNNSYFDPSNLLNPSVIVTTTTFQGISKRFTTDVSQNQSFLHEFLVPKGLQSITVEFTAQYKHETANQVKNVNSQKTINVNVPKDHGMVNISMRQEDKTKFLFYFRGKAGEPLCRRRVSFELCYRSTSSRSNFELFTDGKGIVNVTCTGVTKIKAQLDSFSQIFYLSKGETICNFVFKPGKFSLPLQSSKENYSHCRLVETVDFRGSIVKNLLQSPKILGSQCGPGYVELDLKPGCYKFSAVSNLSSSDSIVVYNILILPSVISSRDHQLFDSNFGSLRMLNQVSQFHKPLPVLKNIQHGEGKLEVEIIGSSSSNIQIFAVASSFFSNSYPSFQPNGSQSIKNQSIYGEQSKLIGPVSRVESEELLYVANRKRLSSQINSFFPPTTLLLAPKSTKTAASHVQSLGGGSEFASFPAECRSAMRMAPMSRCMAGGGRDSGEKLEVIPWLGNQSSVVKVDFDQDGKGKVEIDDNVSFVRVIVIDGERRFFYNLPIFVSKFPRVNTLLTSAVEVSNPEIEKFKLILKDQEQLTIPNCDPLASKFQILNSPAMIFSAFVAFNPSLKPVLSSLDFVNDWFDLSTDQKTHKFLTNYCDELLLSIFLFDKPFFLSHLKPIFSSSRGSIQSLVVRAFVANDEDILNNYSKPQKFHLLDNFEKIIVIWWISLSDMSICQSNLIKQLRSEALKISNFPRRNNFADCILQCENISKIPSMERTSDNREVSPTTMKEKSRLVNDKLPVTEILVNFCEYLVGFERGNCFLPQKFLSLADDPSMSSFCLFFCVLSLSIKKTEYFSKFDKNLATLELQSDSPLMVLHKNVHFADENFKKDSKILVRSSIEPIQKQNDPISSFLISTPYVLKIHITNISVRKLTLNILQRLPATFIPIDQAENLTSQSVSLQPFKQSVVEVPFYFPNKGEFTVPSCSVSSFGKVIATSDPFTIKVIDFDDVRQSASDSLVSDLNFAQLVHANIDDVVEFLNTKSLSGCDLGMLRHHTREYSSLVKILTCLQAAGRFDARIWYSILNFSTQFLESEFFIRQLISSPAGDHLRRKLHPKISSGLIDLDLFCDKSGSFAKKFNFFDHVLKEYHPYIEPRAHYFDKIQSIPNQSFSDTVTNLMFFSLFYKDIPNSVLLQMVNVNLQLNNVSRALILFNRIKSRNCQNFSTMIQFKYISEILNYRCGKELSVIPSELVNHPLTRWRTRFSELFAFINGDFLKAKIGESESIGDDLEFERFKLMGQKEQNVLEISRKGNELHLISSFTSVKISFWILNLELLFSLNPHFESSTLIPFTKPAASYEHTCSNQDSIFEIPEHLREQSLLVSVSGGGISKNLVISSEEITVDYHNGSLFVGRNLQGLPAAYVKIYGNNGKNGRIEFIMDNFTDFMGNITILKQIMLNNSELFVFVCTTKGELVIKNITI